VDDELDHARLRQQDAPAPQLRQKKIDQALRPALDLGHRRQPARHRRRLGAAESREPVLLHEGAELARDIGDHRRRRGLPGPERAPRVTHRAEQQGVAELIVRGAASPKPVEVIRAQRAPAHEVTLLGWQRHRRRPSLVAHEPPSGHAPSPLRSRPRRSRGSAKPTSAGHARTVRHRWRRDEFPDRMIAGRQDGRSQQKAIDAAFRDSGLTPRRLQDLVAAAEAARDALRVAHLSRHLATRTLLTEAQIARYRALRGYGTDPCAADPLDTDATTGQRDGRCG
jgi:hypothetical protein